MQLVQAQAFVISIVLARAEPEKELTDLSPLSIPQKTAEN